MILLKETFVSKKIGENKDYGFENKWLKEYSRFSKSKELTKEMVQALVEKILIKSDREVEIVLKSADEFERISEYMKRGYKGVASGYLLKMKPVVKVKALPINESC